MFNLNNYIKTDRVTWKKIIKCAIAYEIGTILILIPQVAYKVGGSVPYLVVLGCLFFNASGTAGNQIVEMALNVFVLVPSCIWCGIIAYICTIYNRHIESDSLYWNGASIIAALGFFIAVFVISYIRLKYPRLFIPCLQGFVIPFFGLTRGIYGTEYSVMSIVDIFYPVLLGGGIALLVNLVIWPETAAKVSEQSFGSALASIQNVLEFIEDEVLKECAVTFSDLEVSQKLRQIIKTLDNDISKMQTARKEAKYEIVISRYNPVWYKSFAETMDTMSRSLYGFSLAVEREGQVIKRQQIFDELNKNNNNDQTQLLEEEEEQKYLRLRRNRHEKVNDELSAMKQAEFMTLATSKKLKDGTVSKIEYKLLSHLQSSVQPEMKKFIHICTNVMRCIQRRLRDNGAIPNGKDIVHTCTNQTHGHDLAEAMKSLNRAKIILQNEYEERRAEPTEDHFLIYTVLFSLTQFGKRLSELENETDQLIQRRTNGRFPRVFFPRVNIRKWLGEAGDSAKGERNAAEQLLFEQQSVRRASEDQTESDIDEELGESSQSSTDQSENKTTTTNRNRLSVESDWVEQDQNQSIPLHNAPGPHRWNKWLYSFNNWIKTDPFRYAVKFTITMTLLALMAWLPIPGVNELYNNNHGQWGLLSAMVVFNFTVGSTALQCLFRLMATIIGAVAGYICLLAANRNERPYVLAILTLVFQIPMWYSLLASKYPRIGFISLLTMSVISSTGFMDQYKEDLFAPVWKRTLTAILSIIVVLIIDQLLWPVWARKIMRKHLSDLLIDTGIQFSKVASLVCQENTQSHRYKCVLADCQRNSKALRRHHQLTCQMLGLAQMEPRVTKDAFPIQIYGQILEHEQHILYWIDHLLVTQAFISTQVRKKIMNPMNPYRKELAAAIHLYLFTLAGSLRTKSSLPASLPSAEIARKLLQKRQAILWHENFDELCQLTNDGDNAAAMNQDAINQRKCERGAENQIYWQTYAAGSIEVIVEQEIMTELVAKLMGQHVFKAATKDWII